MILTTFSEKRGCATTKVTTIGGSAGSLTQMFSIPQSIHSCSSSLNSREVRWRNILNTPSRFEHSSPVFDACLIQTQLNSTGGLTNDRN